MTPSANVRIRLPRAFEPAATDGGLPHHHVGMAASRNAEQAPATTITQR